MFRVVIIDDFPLDRRMIAQSIHSFQDLALEVVGECENGIEALEIIHELSPDIILCDVEMPQLNGLELADILRKENSDVHIVFCSLYEKLHYLKSAIDVHSDGYIMKPFTEEKLHETLRSVILQMTDIKALKDELDNLKGFFTNNRHEFVRLFFLDLIHNYIPDKQEIINKCHLLGLIPEIGYHLAVVEIDDFFSVSIQQLNKESSIIAYRVFRFLEENTNKSVPYYTIRMNDKQYMLLFPITDNAHPWATKRIFVETLNRLVRKLRNMSISVTATFSDQIADIMEIKTQCELCQYHLQYKWMLGKGRIIYPNEVPGRAPQKEINVVDIQLRLRLILNDKQQNITEKSEQFVHEIMEPLNPQQQRICFQYIMTCIQMILQENGINIMDVYDESLSVLFIKLLESGSFFERKTAVLDLLNRSHAYLHFCDKDSRSTFIRNVKHYILKSDLKNLNLSSIAEHFSYSPNYLNTIFRDEVGITILEYITQCRIQRAKELLRNPKAKLNEIAEALGYSNAAYFSVVFKKKEGISPKNYMERGR